MASIASSLVRGQITLLNPLLQLLDTEKTRKLQEALGRLHQRVLKNKVSFIDVPKISASWAKPDDSISDTCILYLHGGSYIAGGEDYSKGFGGILASELVSNVLCLNYRLAPENPFPAALEDALEAYKYALKIFPAPKIAVIGESAGGGLSFSLLLKIKELGLAMPSCVITISPWCDLTMEYATENDCKKDPVLSCEGLLYSAKLYAGDIELDNPFVSPLYGDLSSMPDSLIFVGTDEVLVHDSIRMYDKLTQHGNKSKLHVEEDLWHVYVLYGLPESRRAIDKMHEFFLEHTSG